MNQYVIDEVVRNLCDFPENKLYSLLDYIDFLKNGLQKKSSKTDNKSFYQLTKHLAGSLDGPSDLGHNKEYLQGFGE